MRQVPQLGLSMPAALAACRPDALAQVGRALAAAADAWRGIAGGADSRAAGMTSAGWRGAGATAFASAAQTQVTFVRQGAAVVDELAQAVGVAAQRLDAARRDAAAAVERGRLLDEEARRLDPTSLSYLATHPSSSPALLIAAADAERLEAEMQRTRQALTLAEADARRCWTALQAACRAAAYERPVVRSRLAAASWDPAASVQFVAAQPGAAAACTEMDQLGLPEGGVVTGPDGRDYPLVVQTGISREGRLIPTTRDTARTIAGWHATAELTGETEIGPKAETWQKWAVALGGVGQLELPPGAAFDPAKLAELELMPGGGAQVPLEAEPVDPAPRDKYDYERRFSAHPYWAAPDAGIARGGRAVVPDVAVLAVNALAGIARARTLDDARVSRYRIVFEEDGSGRRRARMQFFRVMSTPGGQTVTVAAGAYVGRNGRLAGVPVTEEDRDAPTVAANPGR